MKKIVLSTKIKIPHYLPVGNEIKNEIKTWHYLVRDIYLSQSRYMETLRFDPSSFNPQQSIETAINNIFPLESEENKATKLRKALGETGMVLQNEQIEVIGTEFQFLIDSWMDEFEQDVFNGHTLKEVLNDG